MFLIEITRRVRSERAVARADQALLPFSRPLGVDPDHRPMAEQLEALASERGFGHGAPSRRPSCVDDQTGIAVRVTSGPGASRWVERDRPPARWPRRTARTCRRRWRSSVRAVLLGEMQVTSAPGHDFTTADLLVLRLLAPRVAAHVERVHLANAERRSRLEAEQARRQVNVLARASVPLAPGLEHPEETIRELADIVVPEFADLFAVDLVRDGGRLERIVVTYSDPRMASSFEELSADRPDWRDTLRRVMTLEESELVFSTDVDEEAARRRSRRVAARARPAVLGRGADPCPWRVDRHDDACHHPQPARVPPVRSGHDQRSRRPQRDRVRARTALRGGEAGSQRSVAAGEPTGADGRGHHRPDPHVGADRACSRARPSKRRSSSRRHAPRSNCSATTAPKRSTAAHAADPVCISRPLVGHLGEEIGRLTVERPRGVPFAADDGAVVTMLAESASVASRNAHLYQDASDREQRLQALIEASPLAILEIESAGTVLVANPAARALFPVPSSEATELVHIPPELVDPLADLVSATVRWASGARSS